MSVAAPETAQSPPGRADVSSAPRLNRQPPPECLPLTPDQQNVRLYSPQSTPIFPLTDEPEPLIPFKHVKSPIHECQKLPFSSGQMYLRTWNRVGIICQFFHSELPCRDSSVLIINGHVEKMIPPLCAEPSLLFRYIFKFMRNHNFKKMS
jgi:hypothetical protein